MWEELYGLLERKGCYAADWVQDSKRRVEKLFSRTKQIKLASRMD